MQPLYFPGLPSVGQEVCLIESYEIGGLLECLHADPLK